MRASGTARVGDVAVGPTDVHEPRAPAPNSGVQVQKQLGGIAGARDASYLLSQSFHFCRSEEKITLNSKRFPMR